MITALPSLWAGGDGEGNSPMKIISTQVSECCQPALTALLVVL